MTWEKAAYRVARVVAKQPEPPMGYACMNKGNVAEFVIPMN